MRLAKYIAHRGFGSRRVIDRYIQAQGAQINNKLHYDPAYQVKDQDKIIFQGQAVPAQRPPEKIFLFYKPRGMLTTHRDPFGRLSLKETLDTLGHDLKSVGRLDGESEGLLILTNNTELKRYLELPVHGVKRTYCVFYTGQLTPQHRLSLAKGVTINGFAYQPCFIRKPQKDQQHENYFAQQNTPYASCIAEIYEGKNREIRKLFKACGCDVKRLIRIAYGRFSLPTLTPGAYKKL